jgi:hypothetical protein
MTGAAAGLGVIAADALAAAPARAAQGSAVLEGQDNTGATSRTAVFTTMNNEIGILADPGTSGKGSLGVLGIAQDVGVQGEGVGRFGTGVFGVGGPSGGAGVVGSGGTDGAGVAGVGDGSGTGVTGIGGPSGGTGVSGNAISATGNGVLAENTGGGAALRVIGHAAFSRSGILTVPAGHSAVTHPRIPLTQASFVLATIQANHAGITIQGVTLVTGSSGSLTIHLNKKVASHTKVAWLAIN